MAIKLLRITTVPESLHLLLNGQLTFLQKQGFEVRAASAGGRHAAALTQAGIPHHVVAFTRKITPLADLRALAQLVRLMRQFRPHVVHTHTPKAGLLGMLAAWICRVPVRMHTVAGLPLMEARGLKRHLLYLTESLTYACAHGVYPNSSGLLAYMQRHFSTFSGKYRVIGRGSSNGIDVEHFTPTPQLLERARALRNSLGIPPQATVIGFVGRLVKDKGIAELTEAFRQIHAAHPNTWLLLVGHPEPDLDPLHPHDRAFLESHPQVIMPGFQDDVRPWILAMDVFALPSYREGFPNVVMQAACLEVPCVVSDINGCNELIQHPTTGWVVPPTDVPALATALLEAIKNPALAKIRAAGARRFVQMHFQQHTFWNELLCEYRRQLERARCRSVYAAVVKPLFDRLAAGLLLLFSFPLWIPVMLVLLVQNKGQVFFRQLRPGKDEKLFSLWKFKTMTDARDVEGNLLPDALRLTRVGKLVRKTSLDELPQLINVLRGEMSLVGPRPLLPEYLPLYNDHQRRRHWVKPGITGWAQVNGRNTVSWQRRFDYDVWYVHHQSFALDLKILWLTLLKVLKAEGINSATAATMERFTGNSNLNAVG